MKGLIMKDIYNLKSVLKIVAALILFCLVFRVATGSSNNFIGNYITTYVMVYLSLLPISSAAYDEQTLWNVYETSLPVTRREVVLSRYLLGLLFIFSGLFLSALVNLINKMELNEILVDIAIKTGIALLVHAIEFPLIIKLGSEKARNYVLMGLFVGIALIFGLGNMNIIDFSLIIKNMGWLISNGVYLLFASSLVLYVLSIFASIKIYDRKEI